MTAGPAVPRLHGVDDGSLPDFMRAFDLTFGQIGTPERVDRLRAWIELDRLVAASVSGQVVATSGAFSFEMSLPFASSAPCAGITLVSVRADQRRRGLLTRMMGSLLDDASERGEPLAALWASEAPIYGRFGFGPAAPTLNLEIERAVRFRTEGPVEDVVLVDRADAGSAFPALYEAARRTRPGTMGRSDGWWRRELDDPDDRREGAGEKRYALLPGRGYATYRLRAGWGAGVPDGTVEVLDLVTLDGVANAALWRFVIDTDLSVRTRAGRRPVDDPLLVSVTDPARLHAGHDWPLQLRLVDLPRALTSRGYRVDDTLVLGVHDAFRPANQGTWRLVVEGGVATCEPTDGPADLELDIATLGAVFLGGQRTTTFAAAGQVTAPDRSAPARLDRLMAADVAPWHGGMF
ncbi:GNAT family N-acetyltransferase [Nitriliruptor alkaliphilus]|uniref:GNAT family N-acetyltransferase n=1 Tax=Nitriliruptor alkaliphilus TaxID=427918 RepID=UPI0006964234|nr:GNAT family N-acetyltransferase [Nitriliruptor alkaliphilus]